MEFKDGYKLYHLQGVEVPEKFITTDKQNIKPSEVLELSNTEQRRVLMNHIGLENFIDSFNPKELDKKDNYKLLLLTYENELIGPYLYMECPSTGRKYLEGVGNPEKYENIDTSILTVEQALSWRYSSASKGLIDKILIDLKQQT